MNPLFTDTVVIVRPATTTDRYGNTVLDWDAATRTSVPGVSVQPDTQAEADDGTRDTTQSTWWLRTPIDAGDLDIAPTDRVEHAGLTLEVDGDPRRYPGLLAEGVSCVHVHLRQVVDR